VKAPGTPTIMYFPLEGNETVLLSFSTQRLPGAAGIDEPTEIMANWTNFCENLRSVGWCLLLPRDENAGLVAGGGGEKFIGLLLNTSYRLARIRSST